MLPLTSPQPSTFGTRFNFATEVRNLDGNSEELKAAFDTLGPAIQNETGGRRDNSGSATVKRATDKEKRRYGGIFKFVYTLPASHVMFKDWNGQFTKTLQGINTAEELAGAKETIINLINFVKNFVPEQKD